MAPRGASPATADHVIGIFSRDDLSAALAAVHRSGYGPQTRVIDGARGDVGGQLRRAGLRLHDELAFESGALLIVVTAPGRVAAVSELFSQLRAERIVLARRRDEEHQAAVQSALLTPDIRIGDASVLADV